MARVSLSFADVRKQLQSDLEALKQQRGLLDAQIADAEGWLKSLGDANINIPSITLPGVAGRYGLGTRKVSNAAVKKATKKAAKKGKRGRPVGSGKKTAKKATKKTAKKKSDVPF